MPRATVIDAFTLRDEVMNVSRHRAARESLSPDVLRQWSDEIGALGRELAAAQMSLAFERQRNIGGVFEATIIRLSPALSVIEGGLSSCLNT